MKKLVLIIIVSTALVACGEAKTTTVLPEPTTSTVGEEPTTTSNMIDLVTPTEEVQEAGTPAPPKPVVAKPTGSGSIGRISIPSVDVSWPIYEGIALSVLNKGPGHYPHSPKPCRAGNAAIAGHRTTYGAPFNKLDLLKDGDVINITTPEGDCTYKYLRTEIVFPTNVSIVMPKDGNSNLLTLTACHPKGSAKQRIAVTAQLVNVVVH